MIILPLRGIEISTVLDEKNGFWRNCPMPQLDSSHAFPSPLAVLGQIVVFPDTLRPAELRNAQPQQLSSEPISVMGGLLDENLRDLAKEGIENEGRLCYI
jgi:hypothetical protein